MTPSENRARAVGDFITRRILGIDVDERYARQPADLDRRAYDLLDPADVFFEEEPSVAEFLREFVPTRQGAMRYVQSLFPATSWIGRYCMRWLLGDSIAGITIGLVIVPQAMAYAALAQLPPAYGLYTSFTGAALYWLFGTSKDIVIGATAVGSLLVGQVIGRVQEHEPGKYTNREIAHTLSLLSGCVMLFFGLLRLGWIIEFIPYIPISAFVTAASITIMCTQIPTVMGIPDINTREAPYKVMINTLKGLPNSRMDAAIGLSSIALLFGLRDLCAMMERRQPARKRMWSLLASMRMTFVMLLFILVSFLVNRPHGIDQSPFRVVGHIETGFQQAGVPKLDRNLVSLVLPELPAICIILIIEHIAISKSMGRLHSYAVDPSQEIVALGSANLFSPFVGGYVCTGSFGASAVLSKAGVRTPLASFLSAGILILALYVLTVVFQYIPKAALAGLIIHAVCNLLAPPKNLYRYWQLSPLDLLIWITGVLLAVFESLETAIYVGIALSFAVLLVRLARTKGQFMGRVRVHRVTEEGNEKHQQQPSSQHSEGHSYDQNLEDVRKPSSRVIYMPIDRRDRSNPDIDVQTPYPGVFIYRFSEGFNYLNQAMHMTYLSQYIMARTRRTSDEYLEKKSDRLWNDPGPKTPTKGIDVLEDEQTILPHLRAVVFDCSAINNLDVTCVQGLMDLRDALDRYCAPDAVEVHFASVHNRWTRRALAVSGFGFPSALSDPAVDAWHPAYTIASIIGPGLSSPSAHKHSRRVHDLESATSDDETLAATDSPRRNSGRAKAGMAATHGVNRPFFHVDLAEAVDAAVRDAQGRDGRP
ncbi:solute carrier family 26 (sodium-independent sulfate anion transporter), member 11 [Geosmithia morbida]|uniref:Solute carrier family 26 (Sodium-independent sulfate anion transporter), member 11 n=1 Tax=Geosmithia morbida TaxID=1094350 RepID=A0A9P5D3S0_9HYPO|nr:solute carrier family 26 (sodium-independent sulfate anion transporter), member 11 [Geosmithia morbida]KAF4126513.1 solute carrier family 26 (sodium-independent sulfate anion transporter), member 11 [Geosmithia morbida]